MGHSLRIRKTASLLSCGFFVALIQFAAASGARDPLANLVTIYRDNYGVPHIVGETEEATFFGYGYAQAEDHLEKMMTQYLDAQGRRAEVEGINALGDGYLHFIPYEYRWDGDYLQRLLRTKKTVVENRAKIDPAVYKILNGFARGVNYYIAEHRASIPSWIEPIAPEDVEALERSHYMRFYSVQDALMKMSDQTHSFPNFGSNQWAIARKKSANGRIMHVEHTHMPWANRFQNYEAHLITPGKLDAAGISWFGSPVFLDGLNSQITWSATWNQPNISDVYEEKTNPENDLLYLYEGKWLPVRVEREVFHIKGPNGLESVTLPLYYTHHGPIVRFDKQTHRAWSIRLPNFDGVNYALGLYGIMKAGNLDEFKQAVARQLMPRWNLLYSDPNNIYWVHNGNVAERNPKYNWFKPVPGWTKDTEWGPFFPFPQYPQLQNPGSGFLQNCNNPYWVATKNSGLKPNDPAPYYLSYPVKPNAGEEALNTRGERIFQVLTQPRKFTLAEMMDLGFDTYVLGADVFVPLLEKAARRNDRQDAATALAIERIRSWNRRSSPDSTAFSFVYYWAKTYERIYGAAKYHRFYAHDRSKAVDIESVEEQNMAWRALVEGANILQQRFAKPEIAWGEINTVVRGDVFPTDGAGELFGMLHPDEGPEQDDGRIRCNDGWGHLLVVMEGQPREVWSLLPYGQSEHPSSPHYNDQARLHSQRKAKRFWLTPSEILDHTESVWGDRGRMERLLAHRERQ